jgi:hypothetical protein
VSPAAWFSALGEPLGEAETADIAAYLAGLKLAAVPARAVASWRAAEEVVRAPAGRWWDAEEVERARLDGIARLDPADREWLALTDTLHGAAAVAAARGGCTDQGLIRAAAGAATYAVHQYRLVRAAGGGDDHPFVRKYALFSEGRWPLGVYGDRFVIF